MVEYTGIERRKRIGNVTNRASYNWQTLNVMRHTDKTRALFSKIADSPHRAATQPEARIITQERPKPNKPAKPTAPPRDTMTPSDIRTLRKSLNLTQPEFAELVGVSAITVSFWECGTRNPSGSAIKVMRTLKTKNVHYEA